jgi:hypothetical protein
MDGQNIDLSGLLEAFQQYWSLNSERFLKGASYTEGAPHYYLAAFLQRVVNGGATLINEFADGLGYGDILIQYAGKSYVIETKIKDNEISRAQSLEQTLRYMDGLLVNEGWLVVFDRKSEKSWKDKITWDTKIMPNGETIHVVDC